MRIYLKENVYIAALNRIRYLFDEFPEIVVGFSGGKDSTVIFNLVMQVAKERKRLPLKVLFIDQEAEWQAVIDFVDSIMRKNDVNPMWFQMPMRLFNATSYQDQWLDCWKEGKEWIREKSDISIKVNKYNSDRFADLFTKIFNVEFKDRKACYISGVRGEESPARVLGTTQSLTYKHVTWGKTLNKKMQHFTFYPIYDWSYTDVWKAIHDNNWEYCKLYDYMYIYGIQVRDMRVSNVHHETALKSLYYLQEIEPKTWEKLVSRIRGINTAKHVKDKIFKVKELPFMFETWKEYRDYLLDKLVVDKEHKKRFRSFFNRVDRDYTHNLINTHANKICIRAILKNDYFLTTLNNFRVNLMVYTYRKVKAGKLKKENIRVYNKYVEEI